MPFTKAVKGKPASSGKPWAKGGDSPFSAPDAKDKAAQKKRKKKQNHKGAGNVPPQFMSHATSKPNFGNFSANKSGKSAATAAEIQQATLINRLKNKGK